MNKCIDCGKEIARGSTRCRSCAKSGVNNPAFKDGSGKSRYLDGEILKRGINELKKENKKLKNQIITDKTVSEFILEIKNTKKTVPDWLVDVSPGKKGTPCVPTLQLSDIHYGETVFPEQVFGKNEYNIKIANERLRLLCENTIDLLLNHMEHDTEYPGLVIAINGDLVTGDIHEELTQTNDTPIMPAIVELYENLIVFLERLADVFGKLFVPCTVGNHGRITRKPQAKNKVYTNYDWLICKLLEKHFEDDDRVNIVVSAGSDIQYKVYNHKYRQTHGDQFRGGQGFIGPFAPITRGEIKKRSAAITYGEDYDTLIIGHFHQLMFLNRVIVNGSVVGFNEFALQCNFPYEAPQQALWLTHPVKGVTLRAPVFCSETEIGENDAPWISWKEM